jgi:hypothetical protein
MQPTNKANFQRQSRCIYCGSPTYGKGCRYAPHSVHFHPDDPTKCAYCKSANYGRGCKINPTSDLHIHGINYNSMFKENVQSFLDNEIFLKEVKKDYKHFAAFKLGIIDESGNKLRNPVTEAEQAAFSPMVKTIIRMKKFLGSKVDLLDTNPTLTINNESVETYKKLVEYRAKIEDLVNEIYSTFDQAVEDGLTFEDIKKLIKA